MDNKEGRLLMEACRLDYQPRTCFILIWDLIAYSNTKTSELSSKVILFNNDINLGCWGLQSKLRYSRNGLHDF